MSKKIFLTFADSRMTAALNRISLQVNQIKIYDEILVLDENSLDEGFFEIFTTNFDPKSRGYGYWCWKPYLILKALESAADGDLLQWTDAGCHINSRGRERLLHYFSLVRDLDGIGVLAFQAGVPTGPLYRDDRVFLNLPDSEWTKGDLIDYFCVRGRLDILKSPTIGSGIIFFRNSVDVRQFVREWLQVWVADFRLIDDTPSVSSNYPEFKEHRHDQAAFSLLSKLNGVKTLSAYEYWYPSREDPFQPDWKVIEDFPIHAKRDRGLIKKRRWLGVMVKIRKFLSRSFDGR